MMAMRHFNITPPPDIAEALEAKVESGAYACVDDVILDGLRAFVDENSAIEHWLRNEVVAGHAEYLADPSKGVPSGAILKRIRQRRAASKIR